MKRFAFLAFVILAASMQGQTYTVTDFYDFPSAQEGPTGITVASNGNIFVCGVFAPGGQDLTSIQVIGASNGNGNSQTTLVAGGAFKGVANGTGFSAQFNGPDALAIDQLGDILVAESANRDVRVVTYPGGVVTTLTGANGSTNAFGSPTGLAVYGANIYILDGGSSQVYEYVQGANPSTIVTASAFPTVTGTNSVISSIACDPSGNLLVGVRLPAQDGATGSGGFGVYRITSTGPTQLFLDTSATNVSLLAVDPQSNIFIASPEAVYEVTGVATATQIAAFTEIAGLAFAPNGNLYVAYTDGSYIGHIALLTASGFQPTPTPTPTPSPTIVGSSGAAVRLVNLSNRSFVGTGANISIAGFIISGTASEEVLIRGVGPALAQFGVNGVLQSPVLTLFDSKGNVLETNTGWALAPNAPQISAAEAATGAFALGEADTAILTTLPPGSYTAQVSGANNSTGVALTEVYEVPTPSPTPTP